MIPVRVSRLAFNDLNAIWEHIASDNEAAANRYEKLIADSIAQLADHPLLGRARPEYGDHSRALVVGDYLIIYQLRADRVDVSRVIHGARDIPRTLGNSTDRRD